MNEDVKYEELSETGVLTAFHTGLRRSKEHLLAALHEAHPGGSHVELSYNFHVGVALLMAIFDGIALHSEKRVFATLLKVQERSLNRDINGATMATLHHDIVTGFKPWKVRVEKTDDTWDVHLTSGSGPLMRDLVFPLFNDACEALTILYGLAGLEWDPIHAL